MSVPVKFLHIVDSLRLTRTVVEDLNSEYRDLKESYPEIIRIEPELKDLVSQQLFLEARVQKMTDTTRALIPTLPSLVLDTGKEMGLIYAVASHEKAVKKFKEGMKCIRIAIKEKKTNPLKAINFCIPERQETFQGLFAPDSFGDLIKLGLIGYAGVQSIRYLLPMIEKFSKGKGGKTKPR